MQIRHAASNQILVVEMAWNKATDAVVGKDLLFARSAVSGLLFNFWQIGLTANFGLIL